MVCASPADPALPPGPDLPTHPISSPFQPLPAPVLDLPGPAGILPSAGAYSKALATLLVQHLAVPSPRASATARAHTIQVPAAQCSHGIGLYNKHSSGVVLLSNYSLYQKKGDLHFKIRWFLCMLSSINHSETLNTILLQSTKTKFKYLPWILTVSQ